MFETGSSVLMAFPFNFAAATKRRSAHIIQPGEATASLPKRLQAVGSPTVNHPSFNAPPQIHETSTMQTRQSNIQFRIPAILGDADRSRPWCTVPLHTHEGNTHTHPFGFTLGCDAVAFSAHSATNTEEI